MFFHSMSVNPLWTRVLAGCLGNGHMTILRASAVMDRGIESSKGKSLKAPLLNLIKCDENQRPQLSDAWNSAETETERTCFFVESFETSWTQWSKCCAAPTAWFVKREWINGIIWDWSFFSSYAQRYSEEPIAMDVTTLDVTVISYRFPPFIFHKYI